MSRFNKKRYAEDTEYRETLKKRSRDRYRNSAGVRERVLQQMKIKYLDPEFRARMAERVRTHKQKAKRDPKTYLAIKYSRMLSRVTGRSKRKDWQYYRHLPIMAKDEFIARSLADKAFLKLFSVWKLSGFRLRDTPVPDRIDSNHGYVWSNIEWVTFSENAKRACEVKGRAA